MPILRVRASTFTQSGAGTWASVANATNAGDGTFATWTDASRRGASTGTFGGFSLAGLPANYTINSVSAEMRHYVSATADMNTVTIAGTSVAYTQAAAVVAQDLGTTIPTTVDVVWTRGNNTRSTTCYVDWLDLVIDYTEIIYGSLSTLTDDFASGYAGKWPGSYGTIVTANGEAVIQRNDPFGYSALYTSPTKYDCRNGELVVRVRLPGRGAGGREFSVELRLDANNYVQFYMTGYPGGEVVAVLRQNAVTTYPGSLVLPVGTFWLRFSVTNSVVTYSYSPDRVNWTTLGTATPSFSMNGLEVHMVSGAWQSEGAYDAGFGYVNVQPPVAAAWDGTKWQSGAEIWNGSRWVKPELWNGSRWIPLGGA